MSKPQRIRANYKKNHGTWMFHAWYSVGDDTVWGVIHPNKSQRNTLRALRSIRATRPDGETIYVILDNLGSHGGAMRDVVSQEQRRALLHADLRLMGNPIEARFGPLKEFVLNNSDHRNHAALSKALHRCLRWRNKNPRDPEILRAERKQRAKIRSERQIGWGMPKKSRAA
jgi:hypothetical protein